MDAGDYLRIGVARMCIDLGPHIAADRVTCYSTSDRSDRVGEHEVASVDTLEEFARAGIVWNTLLWG